MDERKCGLTWIQMKTPNRREFSAADVSLIQPYGGRFDSDVDPERAQKRLETTQYVSKE